MWCDVMSRDEPSVPGRRLRGPSILIHNLQAILQINEFKLAEPRHRTALLTELNSSI